MTSVLLANTRLLYTHNFVGIPQGVVTVHCMYCWTVLYKPE